jgi:hypothetical protein
MSNLPLAFGELLAGGILLTAGISGSSIADVFAGDLSIKGLDTGSSGGPGGTAGGGSPVGPLGVLAGGFLRKGAKYMPGRKDQGRDGQTSPGGPIVAPGNGVVLRVASDPGGFGPRYPIVRFTDGPYAGQTMYIGHTLAALSAGAHFVAGQVLSYTGRHPIGNASTPGWFEIGFAPGGNPGPFGQKVPF